VHTREKGHGGHLWCRKSSDFILHFFNTEAQREEDMHTREKGHGGHLWCHKLSDFTTHFFNTTCPDFRERHRVKGGRSNPRQKSRRTPVVSQTIGFHNSFFQHRGTE
jgi:hypothetical protein